MPGKEYIIPIGRINAIALALIIPVAIIFGLPFALINGFDTVSIRNLNLSSIVGGGITILAIFLAGAVVHEFLHGFTWSFFASKCWESISFGIKWEYLTPYCHCSEPLKKSHFIFGAIMPCIVLGLIPVIVSYFNGSFKLWFFGFFFTVAASGDLIAIWMLRKVAKNKMIQDHPEEMGFYVEE